MSVAKHAPCSVEIVRNAEQVTGVYSRDPRMARTTIIPASFASGVRTGRTSTVRRGKMRLSLRAMVMAGAILWGGAILLVGLINFFDPNYGVNFLQMTRSVYPWFHSTHALGNVLSERLMASSMEPLQPCFLLGYTTFLPENGTSRHSLKIRICYRWCKPRTCASAKIDALLVKGSCVLRHVL